MHIEAFIFVPPDLSLTLLCFRITSDKMVDILYTVDLNTVKQAVKVGESFNLVIVPPSGVYEQTSIK